MFIQVSCFAAKDTIHPDLKAALHTANQSGKLLLVDFYGSWCPWCTQMDETLADKSVQPVLSKHFYYCKLDVGHFDRHKDCLAKYKVDGVPHLIVFNKDGLSARDQRRSC